MVSSRKWTSLAIGLVCVGTSISRVAGKHPCSERRGEKVPRAEKTCRIDTRRDGSDPDGVKEYDFIVVGAGTTGSVVAAELAKADGCKYSVLVVESGIDLTEDLDHVVPNRVFDAVVSRESVRKYFTSIQEGAPLSLGHQTSSLIGRNYYPRAHTVGGSNAHHAMQSWFPSPTTSAAWVAAASGSESWSHASMITALGDAVSNNYTNLESSDVEFPLQQMLLSASNAFFDARPELVAPLGGRQHGIDGKTLAGQILQTPSEAHDPSMYLGSFRSNPSQTKNGERIWPGIEFMREAETACGPLGAGTDPHFLKRVLFDDITGVPHPLLSRRAVGVEYFTSPNAYLEAGLDFEYQYPLNATFDETETEVAYARHGVILAMGPFETPKFLKLAGFGDPEELATHGIAERVRLPGVGATLVDDIEVSLIYAASAPVQAAYQHRANRDPILYGALWYSPFIQDGVDVDKCSLSTQNLTALTGQEVCPGLDCVDDMSLCAQGPGSEATNPMGNPPGYCIPCFCFRASTWAGPAGPDPCKTGLPFPFPDANVVQDDAMAEWLFSRSGTHGFSPAGEMPFLTYKSGLEGGTGERYEYGDCYTLMTPINFPNYEANRLSIVPLPGNPTTPFPFTLDVLTDAAVQNGRVLLQSANPRHPPSIDPRYFSDESGTERTARCVMHARRFAATLNQTHTGLTGTPGLSETPYFDSPSSIPGNANAAGAPPVLVDRESDNATLWAEELAATIAFIKERAFSHHPVGGNRMGPDTDELAVVDAKLRVRGAQNLFVTDMSIVPEAIPHFPSATAVAVGRIAAKLILEQANAAKKCEPGRSDLIRHGHRRPCDTDSADESESDSEE